MSNVRYTLIALLAAVGFASPAPAHATSIRDFLHAHIDVTLPSNHANFGRYAGNSLRAYTTTQRNAIPSANLTAGDAIWNSSTSAINVWNGSTWTAIGAGGGSGGTLNDAYSAGATISETNVGGGIAIVDTQTQAGNALGISGTGVVTGTVKHSYLNVTSAVTHTTSGTVRGLEIDLSNMGASGTVRGVDVHLAAATSAAFYATKGGLTLVNGVASVTYTEGSNALSVPTGDVSVADGSVTVVDDDNAASLALTNNTATTVGAAASTGVANLVSTSLTTGTLLNLDLTEGTLNGGWYLRAWDATGGAAVFSVAEDGFTTIAGPGTGNPALTVTSGDLLLSSGHATLTSGNFTMAAGTATITSPAAGSAALVVNSTGNFSTAPVDINLGGTGSTSGVDVDVGASLYAGSAVDINVGSTCTGCTALYVAGGAVGRTTDLIGVADTSTGNANAFVVAKGGTGSGAAIKAYNLGTAATGPLFLATSGVNYAGDALSVDFQTAAVSAGVLTVVNGSRAWSDAMFDIQTGTGVFTDDVFELNIAGAGTGHAINAVVSDAFEGDVLHIAYGAAAIGDGVDISASAGWTGVGVKVALANAATTAQALTVNTGARASSSDAVAVTDTDTSTANSVSVTKTGVGSTGAALKLSSTVVAADAAKVLDVTYNGALVAQGGGGVATSASAASYFNCAGSWADDADNTPSACVRIGGAAVGVANDNDAALLLNPTGANMTSLWAVGNSKFTLGAAQYVNLDADTTAHTGTDGVLRVSMTSATDYTPALATYVTASADKAVLGVSSTVDSSGLAGGAGLTGYVSAYVAKFIGNNDAAETGVLSGFYSSAPTTVNAATKVSGLTVDTDHDYALYAFSGNVSFEDYSAVIEAKNTATTGEDITLKGADAAGVDQKGGDVYVIAGIETGTGTPGAIVFQGSDVSTESKVTLMTLDPQADPPLTMSNNGRPTKMSVLYPSAFAAVTGSPTYAEAGATELPELLFDGAADERACAPWSVPLDIAASTNMTPYIEYTSETGGDGIVWVLAYQCEGDSGALAAGGDTTIVCSTDTVDTANDLNVLDCGTNLLWANLGAAGRFCKVCLQRDADGINDTHAADAGLLRLRFTYTSKTP